MHNDDKRWHVALILAAGIALSIGILALIDDNGVTVVKASIAQKSKEIVSEVKAEAQETRKAIAQNKGEILKNRETVVRAESAIIKASRRHMIICVGAVMAGMVITIGFVLFTSATKE